MRAVWFQVVHSAQHPRLNLVLTRQAANREGRDGKERGAHRQDTGRMGFPGAPPPDSDIPNSPFLAATRCASRSRLFSKIDVMDAFAGEGWGTPSRVRPGSRTPAST